MTSSFDEMTLLYSRFLRLILILPFDGRDFATMTNRALFAFYFVSGILHWNMFVFNLINQRGVPTIDAICETVMVVGAWFRYYLLLPHRAEYAALLSECRAIWYAIDQEDRPVVKQFERKIRLVFLGLLGSCYVTIVAYGACAIVINLANARKANDTHGTERFLPLKWYVPGVVDSWPGYEFKFALQMTVMMSAGIITSTVDLAAPLLIMLGAGYCRVVQRRLDRAYERAIKIDDGSHDDVELATCCRLHQRVLSYCTKINKIARTLFLVQLACTGYNTSLIAIKLAGRDPDRYKYIPSVMFTLSQLFICQFTPDHLIEESLAISTAAYNASFPWIKRRAGKLLVLMIARAQKPVQMTAAGVVNLSLENFGYMLKGAVSFFMMLRNFNA